MMGQNLYSNYFKITADDPEILSGVDANGSTLIYDRGYNTLTMSGVDVSLGLGAIVEHATCQGPVSKYGKNEK